jgi:hypothetical protein
MHRPDQRETAAPAVGTPLDCGVGRLESERAAIGAFYVVPCVRAPLGFYGLKWVPVIGPKHRDLELNVDWEHWHVDWRFVPESTFQHASRSSITGHPHGKVVSNDNPDRWGRQQLTGAAELKRRMCRRAMPDFPARPRPIWAAMETAQRARCDKLKDGHTCPHRGIDLRPFAKDDGTAVCPGHGLRWDLRTGLLLARHEPPNAKLTGSYR